MINRTVILFIFILVLKFGVCQNSYVETENINSFFRYRTQIYNSIPNDDWKEIGDEFNLGAVIDTFNVCRIRKSKIKRLDVYLLKSEKDSSLWQSYNYDNKGLISSMNPIIGWYDWLKEDIDTSKFSCPTFDIILEPRKKKVKFYILQGRKVKEKYNDSGYLIQYTEVTLGILNRWISRAIGNDLIKQKTFYSYENDFKTVTVSLCYTRRLFSKKCIPLIYDYIICDFDLKGNLIRELKYKIDDNGLAKVVEGYSYIYEYYK